MQRDRHFCSLLLREPPGLVTHTLKHLSRTVCSQARGRRGARQRRAQSGAATRGGGGGARHGLRRVRPGSSGPPAPCLVKLLHVLHPQRALHLREARGGASAIWCGRARQPRNPRQLHLASQTDLLHDALLLVASGGGEATTGRGRAAERHAAAERRPGIAQSRETRGGCDGGSTKLCAAPPVEKQFSGARCVARGRPGWGRTAQPREKHGRLGNLHGCLPGVILCHAGAQSPVPHGGRRQALTGR
jgi:hypothetical protein